MRRSVLNFYVGRGEDNIFTDGCNKVQALSMCPDTNPVSPPVRAAELAAKAAVAHGVAAAGDDHPT